MFLIINLFLWIPLNFNADAETITDASGKKIDIHLPAERIIVLNSGAAEILYALEACENIVGVTDYIARDCSELFSELKEKPVVGGSQNPSLEKIVELKPDLIIAYDKWGPSPEEFAAKLPCGISTVMIPCYRLNRIKEDILILGKIVGKEKKAEEFVQNLQGYLDEVDKRLKGVKERVRVYAEYGEYTTVSKKSGAGELLERAGVDNIASEERVPFPKVGAEWVVAKNPEVIIKTAHSGRLGIGYGIKDIEQAKNSWEQIISRPLWDRIDAVKNEKVYLISSEIWVGPRTPIGIMYVAKWSYPERFKDIDPEAIHREWLMKWYKKELNGIYVYPR